MNLPPYRTVRPVKAAPLWRGDTFDPGMFGSRFPGGRDPRSMCCLSREDRRRERRVQFLDSDGQWRLRVATADAYGHRKGTP